MKKFLIYLGHPAHFHLFKNTIKYLKKQKNEVLVVIKKKDILEELLISQNIPYKNILSEGKNEGKLSLAWSLIKRNYRLYKLVKQFKPNLMMGTSAEISHIGKLLSIESYVFNEDDWDVVPGFSRLVYPFANKLFAPEGCRMGKWESKTHYYNSYHELAYLHPENFEPSKDVINSFHSSEEPFFILRFVQLEAHHDHGVQGLSNSQAKQLINILEPYGKVYITSERKLNSALEPHRITIDPLDIHHALYFAKAFVGDSQTMAAEAMVLGTPSFRFNDFVGRISYLEQLENEYELGFGYKTHQFDMLCKCLSGLMDNKNTTTIWNERKERMLSEKINLTDFIVENLVEADSKK